jgi:hypothetical protein
MATVKRHARALRGRASSAKVIPFVTCREIVKSASFPLDDSGKS